MPPIDSSSGVERALLTIAQAIMNHAQQIIYWLISTSTAGSNYNNTSFANISQLGTTNIVVPASGKVRVTAVVTISNQTVSIPDNFVRVVVGSSNSKEAKLTTPTQYQGGNLVVNDVITGLTPGATLAVTVQYRNSTGTNVYIDTPYCTAVIEAW